MNLYGSFKKCFFLVVFFYIFLFDQFRNQNSDLSFGASQWPILNTAAKGIGDVLNSPVLRDSLNDHFVPLDNAKYHLHILGGNVRAQRLMIVNNCFVLLIYAWL